MCVCVCATTDRRAGYRTGLGMSACGTLTCGPDLTGGRSESGVIRAERFDAGRLFRRILSVRIITNAPAGENVRPFILTLTGSHARAADEIRTGFRGEFRTSTRVIARSVFRRVSRGRPHSVARVLCFGEEKSSSRHWTECKIIHVSRGCKL